MKYKVLLIHSDEGVSASIPGLPGCWSQGRDEAEALANVTDALRDYLAVVAEQLVGADVREIDIAV
jgi:predicted RNase H-like HicB family nuclease